MRDANEQQEHVPSAAQPSTVGQGRRSIWTTTDAEGERQLTTAGWVAIGVMVVVALYLLYLVTLVTSDPRPSVRLVDLATWLLGGSLLFGALGALAAFWALGAHFNERQSRATVAWLLLSIAATAALIAMASLAVDSARSVQRLRDIAG